MKASKVVVDPLTRQLRKMVGLAVLVGVVWSIHLIWPEFFTYPYLHLNSDATALLGFWPLIIYVVAFGLFALKKVENQVQIQDTTFPKATIISVLAGIWEESTYRGTYICFAMIMVTVGNLLTSTAGYIAGILGVIIAAYFIFMDKDYSLGVFSAFLSVLCVLWGNGTNPVIWMWQQVAFPFLDLVSFNALDGILHSGQNELLVIGALFANGWFKEGSIYTGNLERVNAWVIGLTMIHATFSYGLPVAIMLSIACKITLNTVHYFANTKGEKD